MKSTKKDDDHVLKATYDVTTARLTYAAFGLRLALLAVELGFEDGGLGAKLDCLEPDTAKPTQQLQ